MSANPYVDNNIRTIVDIFEGSNHAIANKGMGITVASRIGFLNDQRLFRASDVMYAETPFIRFLLGFADHFDEVVLISRVFDVPDEKTPLYRLPEEKIRCHRILVP